MKKHLEKLNPQQLDAVKSVKGSSIVVASAGSGKTTMLTTKCAYLVYKGVDPSQILLLTFTNKAAKEMLDRVDNLVNLGDDFQIMGGTFHSFALKMMYNFIERIEPKLKKFNVIDSTDSKSIIKFLIDEKPKYKQYGFPKPNFIQSGFSYSANTYCTIRDYFQGSKHINLILDLKKEYDSYKLKNGMVDYDDLLYYLLKILEDDKLRLRLSRKYKYILVDEFQDTNTPQLEILKYLYSYHKNITLVGDYSQSLYSWRGANPENLIRVADEFENVKILKLEQNYRSTKSIVDLSNKIPLTVDERMHKKAFTVNDIGSKAVCYYALDNYDESIFIVDKIIESKNNGVPYDKHCILFRASFHSTSLELELQKNNIPFVKYGGFKFLEQSHIKDVISLIKICLFPKTDSVSWLRTLFQIKGIGKKNTSLILDEVVNKKLGQEGLRKFSDAKFKKDLVKLYKMINTVRRVKKPELVFNTVLDYYDDYFVNTYGNYKGSLVNPKAVKRMLGIESLLEIGKRYKSVKRFIHDITLEHEDEETDIDDKVILSTIHSFKGLEADNVYIIGLTEGQFPSRYCIKPKEFEEERRVFYVACTRPMNQLYLCSTVENESIFVKELREAGILDEIYTNQNHESFTC